MIQLRSDWRRPAAIALVAVLLRLAVPLAAYVFTDAGPLTREPDSGAYVRLAESLAAGSGFTQDGKPELVRTPGYPLLLIPGVWLNAVDLWAIVFQSVLGGATVWLVYSLAHSAFENTRTATIAALLLALEPVSILYAGKVLSESAFAFLIATVLWLLGSRPDEVGARRYAAAGLLAAAATYVRPIATALATVLACIAIFRRWKLRNATHDRLGYIKPLAMVVVASLCAIAWHARNHVVAGYSGFSAIADINLYFYQAAAVEAAQTNRSLVDVQAEWGYFDGSVYLERHPLQREWTDAQRFAFMRREGTRILKESPWIYTRLHLRGMLNVLFDPGMEAYRDYFHLKRGDAANDPRFLQRLRTAARERPGQLAWRAVLTAFLFVLLLAALSEIIFSLRRFTFDRVLFCTVVVVYLLVFSGGPVGYHRFRVPMTPALCVLAAGPIARIGRGSKNAGGAS